MRFIHGLFLVSCLLALKARAEPIRPGKFFAGNASGTLTLTAGKAGGVHFTIYAEGANGHSCDVSGDLAAGKTEASVPAGDTPCLIQFKKLPSGYEVTVPESAIEACQNFCGARASFDRQYLLVPPACQPKAVAKAVGDFRKAYKAKVFDRAKELLSPVIDNCKDNLDSLRLDQLRNDLAITLHHLGDDAGCLQVLEPLKDMAKQTDAQIEEDYGVEPALVDSALRVARAARTNLKICAAPAAK
jgi:hypothetical protein